jgi:hypothetical protein
MRRWRSHVALALVVTGLTLTTAGCGQGNGAPADDAVTTPTRTYTNDRYGFTITVDSELRQGEPTAQTSAGGEAVLSVVFADEHGPTISGRYVNAIQVSVYELARSLEPAEVPQLRQEVESIVDQLMSSVPSADVVEPLREAEIDGVPGFRFTYTYEEAERRLTAVTFFLFKGRTEYQITTQAASDDWEAVGAKMAAAAESFAVQ